MRITEITVKRADDLPNPRQEVLAYAKVVLDGELAVKDIKVMKVNGKFFIGMPSRKITDRCPKCGEKNALTDQYCSRCGCRRDRSDVTMRGFADVAHPINSKFREYLTSSILNEYQRVVESDG